MKYHNDQWNINNDNRYNMKQSSREVFLGKGA